MSLYGFSPPGWHSRLTTDFHSSCYCSDSQTNETSQWTVSAARWCVSDTVPSSHRKLVLSVMLGEDLATLRAAVLALVALAFRLSWFPLTAASRRDFR